MPIPDDTREFIPGNVKFRDEGESTTYWIRDKTVHWRPYPIRGADVATFRFYLGDFAKDRKNCYCRNKRLTGGTPATFRALNFNFATDGHFVWALGGKVQDADAETFVVCDDGVEYQGSGSRIPNGYGKDKDRVFYSDFQGQPKWVRKASPASFVSFNDTFFGKDENFVFVGYATISKARVEHWKRIGGTYSKDDRRVFHGNTEMKEVDLDSFRVIVTESSNLAKDKRHCYWGSRIIDPAEFDSILKKDFQQISLNPRWLTSTVVDLCKFIKEEFAYDRLPILADALMDAGCDDDKIIARCRLAESHPLGCWVVDLLLAEQ